MTGNNRVELWSAKTLQDSLSQRHRTNQYVNRQDKLGAPCIQFQLQYIQTHLDLSPWLSGLAISGRGAVKAWLAIRQGVGSSPAPAGMSSQVSA